MEICSDGHDEIVHDGGHRSDCPACKVLEEVSQLESEVEALKEELADKE